MTETLMPPLSLGVRTGLLRRGAEDTRLAFLTLLDVLSRPGKVGKLEVPEGVPGTAVAACGLLDVEVGTHVLATDDADGELWAEAVHTATNAPRASLSAARAVVALGPVTAAEIAELNRGDAFDPEQGARLFAPVESIAGDSGAVLVLSGPGIRGERQVVVDGLAVEVVEALIAANSAFPAGVDTFFVAADGSVIGLPRTTRVRIEGDR
jgi:alpha-D-ribose 1-methylphosphonate 5-triphosphate synthase subunit PhnH